MCTMNNIQMLKRQAIMQGRTYKGRRPMTLIERKAMYIAILWGCPTLDASRLP
jgi:hypothetical protein